METGWSQPNGDLVPASTAGHSDWMHCPRPETPATFPSINILSSSSNQEMEGVHTRKYYVDSSGLESAFPGIRASLNLPFGHQVFALQYNPNESSNLSAPETYNPSPTPLGQMPSSEPLSQIVPFPTHAQTPTFSPQEHLCYVTYRSQPVTIVVDASILKGFFLSSEGVWTAYRRNYFDTEASFTIKNLPLEQYAVSDLSVTHKHSNKSISGFALSLSAEETKGKPIELIQHTPRRDRGPTLSVGKCAVTPYGLSVSNMIDKATWNRLQFKLPTRNNGKRQASQQYFYLVIQLLARIDDNEEKDSWVCIAQSRSVPLVIRGRSPSHYQVERSVGTVFQLPRPDAIYSRNEEKNSHVGGLPDCLGSCTAHMLLRKE
jgi:hypothetical protein